MAEEDSQATGGPAQGRRFATTRWSVVAAAAAEQGTQESGVALERLCRIYWYPLYAYARRQGYSWMDAEDLTQGFFNRLLEKRSLIGLDREGGRFRSYLLVAFKHFMANEWAHARTQRRGGGQEPASLESVELEGRYRFEPVDELSPEALYERRWGLAVLDEVLARLQQEYESAERADVFHRLRPMLLGAKLEVAYAAVAAECGTTEGAVKVAVHRLRKRYGELLREEISRTVDRPEEVDAEIRHLIALLAFPGRSDPG